MGLNKLRILENQSNRTLQEYIGFRVENIHIQALIIPSKLKI